jgi:HSP20 family protein
MYAKRNFGLMPRTMNNFMEDFLFNGMNRTTDDASLFQIPVNIKETDGSYEIHVVTPGLKKEDVKILVDKNVLTISYEHKEETNESAPNGKWLRSEFKMRSFKRSFTLNEKVETGKIAAKYNDGILLVSIPKKEIAEASAQEIAIN